MFVKVIYSISLSLNRWTDMDESIESKRNAVAAAYPARKWRDKVEKMPDHQVIALYLKFKAEKKI